MPPLSDTIIIGAGPAGLSAARWCDSHHMSYVVLESTARGGGQLLAAHHPIGDFLGVPSESGPALADAMRRHAEVGHGEHLFNVQVKTIDVASKRVVTDRGEMVGKTMIIATGARPRRLGVPGEPEASGWSIQPPAPVGHARVVVVGGGDNAAEAALALAAGGAQVTLLARGETLRARGKRRSALNGAADVRLGAVVKSIAPDRVTLTSGEIVPCDHLYVRIGYVPNSELVRDQVRCDNEGFILTDGALMTSVPGVFAAGDVVTRPEVHSVANAVGQGAVAARIAYRYVVT